MKFVRFIGFSHPRWLADYVTFRGGRLPASSWYCIYSGTRAGVLTLFRPVYSNSSLIKPRSGCCGLRSVHQSSSLHSEKIFFGWGVRIFCDWRHKWSSFRVILAHVARPRAQLLGQSVSLKFSLETRLKSEPFEPLIDCLAYLVEKLWSKINKLINYLISQIFLLTYITTFEPETSASHPKYQKTWIVA